MHTGSIIDHYDDPTGIVLKKKLAYEQIPDYIRQADYLSQEKRASISDEAFAVVLVDKGEKLRKFACVDKGNTALSVIYFVENRDKLPEQAQKVAAANLVEACEAFGLDIPVELAKIAELTGTDVMPNQSTPATPAMKLPEMPESKIGSGDADDGEDTKMAAFAPGAVSAATQLAHKSVKPLVKAVKPKLASSRYVDVTGFQPAPKFEKKAHANYCLVKEGQGKFPIDSYGDVLNANKWFEEHGNSLHPADRREYCTKLAARADELGISVTDRIRKYAGQGYASEGEVRAAVSTRMQFWADDAPERDMLKGLMGKYASVRPDVFCEALAQFDVLTGMNYHWDQDVLDPWYSTYGIEKKAEWSWVQDADRLTEEQLLKGAQDSLKIYQIKERFGEDTAKGLAAHPKDVFGSLPLDAKRIIARILVDTQ